MDKHTDGALAKESARLGRRGGRRGGLELSGSGRSAVAQGVSAVHS